MPTPDGVRYVREGRGIYRLWLDGVRIGTVVDLDLGDGWHARLAGDAPWGWLAPTRRDAVAGLVAHIRRGAVIVRDTAPDPKE